MKYYFNAFMNYANFSGRATRREYWIFTIVNIILFFVPLYFLNYHSIIGNKSVELGPYLSAYIALFIIIFIIPSISITVRRLHDTNRSGIWYLIQIIPFGEIILLLFCLLPGNSYDNKYGANPRPLEREEG